MRYHQVITELLAAGVGTDELSSLIESLEYLMQKRLSVRFIESEGKFYAEIYDPASPLPSWVEGYVEGGDNIRVMARSEVLELPPASGVQYDIARARAMAAVRHLFP